MRIAHEQVSPLVRVDRAIEISIAQHNAVLNRLYNDARSQRFAASYDMNCNRVIRPDLNEANCGVIGPNESCPE